ncbi:MAG: alkylphosphonate utilization protein [Saprospiraceae bacterium]
MNEKIVTKDSNGNVLAEGDSVLLTKDLKVKGFNKDLKRGTLIKNIRLTSDPGEIEGKVEGSMLVVKTMYLKKK